MAVRPKKYLCTFEGCDKAYNRPALLRQHERTHTNERPFECPVEGCDKSFFRKSHLQVHRHSHQENDEKPFHCRICGKGAISAQLLKRHELTHTKKYKCLFDDCPKAFYHYQSLKHHIDIDHKQILTCDVCNRRFQRPVLLAEHKQKHHGETNVEVLQCDFPGCFLTFKTKTMLQLHKKKEHPQLECKECGETCTGAEALRIHMLAHNTASASQLWKCNLCDASFVAKGELAKHYHDIHDDQPPTEVSHEEDGYVPIIGTAASPSLQSLMRDPSFAADVDKEDMQSPTRGRPKLAKTTEEVSFDSVGSIIDLVLGNITKSYECPRKNCKRKFVRHHAYVKHLEWHKTQVEKAEAYLKNLENEMSSLGEDAALSELDHFTDFSDDEDLTETLTVATMKNGENGTGLPSINDPAQETTENGETDEFANKQLELDALLTLELEKLDE